MSAKPTHQIRIQAIVLAPQGQSDPLKVSNGTTFGATEIKKAIDRANTIYTQAGIHFLFDPAKDLEGESSALSLDNNPDANARENRGALYQGKAVVYFREGDGGYSGEGSFAVVIKPDDGNGLAHELGHYFGLSHVFVEGMTLEGAAQILKASPGTLNLTEVVNKVINSLFDGDAPDKHVAHPVTDTLPSIHEWPTDSANQELPDKCTSSLNINVTVEKDSWPFSHQKHYVFSFTPDRTNVMSYFQGCPQCEKFSPQQINVMRSLIETGNRRHLLGPALRWSGWVEVPGAGITDTSVAATAFGNLILIAKGPTGKLCRNQAGLKGTSLDWGSSWAELEGDGNAGFAPAVTAFDKKIYVFAVGPTGLIYHNFAGEGQPFQPQWFEVPGNGQASGAAAITTFNNKLYAFVVGPSGLIFHNFADPGQPFQSQWFEMPGNGKATGAPAATVFDNKIYVFVVGPSGGIFHNFAGPGQSFQEQWFELPGNGVSITSAAAAVLGQNLYVFIVGGDKRVYMNWAKAGSPFNSWIEVPGLGMTKAAPAVAMWNLQLYLFVKGLDGRIYANSATAN